VGVVESSGAAPRTIAAWTMDGEGFLEVRLHDRPPAYARGWASGDVLATQGDAHIHVDVGGAVKEVVRRDPLTGQGARL
jgi:hypothetical protein